MKIRFLKSITVDVEKPRLKETWPKSFHRWEELMVDEVFEQGRLATLKTYEGDFIVAVPTESFEKVETKKPAL